jgi:hypothetical protein
MGNSYVTGFCSIGSHEGTKPKSPSGKPMKVCEAWETCSCDCHASITKMCEMVGQPRLPMPNPEYVTPERTYWMPRDEPGFGLPEAHPEINAGGVAVAEKVITVTATGRTQRGGLEFWVQRECLAWLVDRDPEYGMPVRILSDEIGRIEGINPPSQGAIAAVFDRWVKYGYAIISEDRPKRFLGLTEQGEKMGLDWCRANAKKQAKA